MRFHWFANDVGDLTVSKINSLASYLESCGYYSFLQVYEPSFSDAFIKSAAVVNNTSNIKYMLAMRPSGITPEYFAMIIAGFSRVAKDRLMINIVHGHLDPAEGAAGIINYDHIFDSREAVLEHSNQFLSMLYKLPPFLLNKPEMVISGVTEQTITMVKNFGDYLAFDYKNIKDDLISDLDSGINKMMRLRLVLKNNQAECENFYHNLRDKSSVLVCTPDSFNNYLDNFQQSGVTDILFAPHPENTDKKSVHEMVRQLGNNT